ncbi:MAG: FtsW/RodA/SpoVE family cell cycle protein [Candidatus Pedobacter colombiensis]|uniref:FtsW/RodA/SpoVE family cell cycle protein n=1 Tax=Candidatus Pedobacter colombiensis TaxID=3121371 RepID=A0AAJ5WDQ2_9SPHI|nr:FtsW/RodA/SpoVE family cell cycle protein [Pedobacter sp.]WEK21701.1 MAG: FtsW/RodA/SpoVE family cell cycle protein [Pedobacter sp.]
MSKQSITTPNRKVERIFLLLITLVLGALFVTLYHAQQQNFADVPQRLANGTMVNINAANPGKQIKTLLNKGYYFEDKKDIDLIENVVTSGIPLYKEAIDNIGELNKRKFFVPADIAFTQGGKNFKERVIASRLLLGFTGSDSLKYKEEQQRPQQLPAQKDFAKGNYGIKGKIVDTAGKPASGVLVRLQMILPQDTAYTEADVVNDFIAYLRTDANGEYNFQHLPDDKAYGVLPLKPGFQFGRSQGLEDLDKNTTLNFRQSPHSIKLFSTRDFKILKKEKSLIVRTPADYNKWYWIIAVSFFAGFFLLHLLMSVKYPQADQLILPIIMLMTGISFLTLLSLQDPLRDRFLARDSLIFYGIGVFSICIMLSIQMRKFNVDSRWYRMLLVKNAYSKAKGWQWAIMALCLLAMTIIFGTGPEGSGVKVNLFGVQPSEIVKYGIILFLAGFFASNERFITEYSSWRKRWIFFSFALFAMVVAILMYLLLGDLGPAMVVCFTFIILFSFSRGDFMMMVTAIIIYVFSAWFLNVWIATLVTAVLVSLIMVINKKTSESAIMIVMVMAAFLLIDQVPYLDKLIPGPVNRLTERKSIWQDPWNNEVYGGDQVANGIWAIASGGISGQGVGQAFAKTIPEAHTDMILPAIGEEFGWTGIIGIFILFLIFLHRAILIGRQTGMPFLFYLCAGVGISLFIQFLLIAGGSTGALPLSGVALPFISYGGSSLVANMLAAGFLLSVSKVKGTTVQMAYITKQQDKNLVPALLAATIAIILLTMTVSNYITHNEKWVVQPALVADKSGARMFSYNPRIAILMNKLAAGDLYDRNGRILATSKPEHIRKQQHELHAAGINYDLDSAEHKRVDRYYPFEEQLFFWVGDNNTGVFNGSTNGYFAEYEHAAELRGFKTPTVSFNTHANKYHEDRFLPKGVKEMTVSKRDYTALAPLLLSGINSAEVEAFKRRNRDVKLTIDAGLQTSIQNTMAQDTAIRNSRVSVVIMEDATGDVLASAVYPLPPIKNWDLLNMPITEQNKLTGWYTTADLGFTTATPPGSTAKVLTTMAAFNKLGPNAANRVFTVSSEERIRTKGVEPDETGRINLERALVKSNNVYFIKIANEEHLQNEMATLYLKTGMFLRGVGGYYYDRDTNNLKQEDKWRALWEKTEFNTKPKYDPARIRRTRAKGISGMAWGQGELIATPAAVARLVSGVANKGKLVANRYVLKISDSATLVNPAIKIANDPQYADLITGYMLKQSENKTYTLGLKVAGKTGTPERIWKDQKINDGWYTFFAPRANGKGHIVVCIRIESTRGSSKAVKLAGQHVIPALLKLGYLSKEKNE